MISVKRNPQLLYNFYMDQLNYYYDIVSEDQSFPHDAIEVLKRKINYLIKNYTITTREDNKWKLQ